MQWLISFSLDELYFDLQAASGNACGADRWMVRRCGMHCCHCIHWDRRRPERLSSGGLSDGGGVHVALSYSRLDCCIDPTLFGNSTNITALATLYLHQSRCACGSAMCRAV